MTKNAIGIVELSSIASGYSTSDEMLKAANVDLLLARSICSGKYMVMVSGDVDSIERSNEVGKTVAGEFLVDDFVIPNVHESIFAAITATTRIKRIASLGVIETFSVASSIMAADAGVKAADVEIIEIRCATGLGGKSFLYLTGSVDSVEAAVEAIMKRLGL